VDTGTGAEASSRSTDNLNNLSRLEEWTCSVETQKTYQGEGVEVEYWKKPSQYALALILVRHTGVSIDSSRKPSEMIRVCQEVLNDSLLVDGRFPEMLDPETKRASRRLNWKARDIFEVAYCLLCLDYQDATTWRCLLDLSKHNTAVENILLRVPDDVEAELYRNKKVKIQKKRARASRKSGYSVKASSPRVFNPDAYEQDWLFDYPDFFMDKRPTEIMSIRREELDNLTKIDRNLQRLEDHRHLDIIPDGISMLQGLKSLENFQLQQPYEVYVAELRRRHTSYPLDKLEEERSLEGSWFGVFYDPDQLFEKLRSERKPESCKRRIM